MRKVAKKLYGYGSDMCRVALNFFFFYNIFIVITSVKKKILKLSGVESPDQLL